MSYGAGANLLLTKAQDRVAWVRSRDSCVGQPPGVLVLHPGRAAHSIGPYSPWSQWTSVGARKDDEGQMVSHRTRRARALQARAIGAEFMPIDGGAMFSGTPPRPPTPARQRGPFRHGKAETALFKKMRVGDAC